jgi:pentatricopeptide repeat protein
MEGLRSQVRALEANTAEAILAAQAESESRLQRRQFIVGFEAEHEEGLALYQERLESMQWQYKLEVDRQCEEQDHFRAARRFHKQNLERLLPPWVAHLDRAVKQCRALGHKDELGWRSQCLTALKQAMQDAMLDTASIQARNEINRVMLDINILQNHEVLGLLTRIRSSYIQHRSDDGTELGTHAANFLEAESRIQNAPVLLPRNQWSDELRGASDTLMHTKSLISTSSIRTGASKPKSMASKTARGIKTKLEFKKSLQDKSPSVKEEGSWVADGASTAADALLSLTAQSSASGPPPSVIASDQEMSIRGLMQRKALDMGIHTSTSEMAKVRMHLVFCANHGDFDSGWEIFLPFVRKMAQFYHVRHPSPGRKQSEVGSPKRAGHKTAQSTASQVPTERKNPFLSESYFELFKLMMTAFKNSSALRLSDSEKVLSLMRENGMAPDVRIYNVMIASCERKSMWRRAIRIFHSMRLPPDCVEPSAQTLEILLSCCRHAVEEPGTIYTLLRKEGLPHE